MATSPPGGFGPKLRAARERRGVSLRQIADATKISVAALEALERNDISRLPGGIFSRAFVRAYALEVGLDPEETIQEFIGQFPHDSVTAGHPTHTAAEDHDSVESSRQMANAFVRLGLVSVPIVALLLYFGGAGLRSAAETPTETRTDAASAPVANPSSATPAATPAATAASEAPAPATDAGSSAEDPSKLSVTLSVTRDCWVSATVDGAKAIDRTMKSGETESLEIRRELALTASDAAAVSLSLNGASARALGSAGQVVSLRMDPTNFRTYLAER